MAAVAGVTLATMSCTDYLETDKYFKDMQSIEHVFENKDNTNQFLAYVYSRLQGDNVEIGHSDICPTNFCDDQTFNEGDNGQRYRQFKLGEYGPGYNLYNTWYQQAWPWSYAAIRQASIFIDNIHPTEDIPEAEATDLRGQARFLRAYFYWLLIKKYGPVPLMPESGADYTKSYDELSFPRNTYDECVEFIDKEMKKAATELPMTRDNMSIARPTKGAALAVRAKVLTYAAREG